MLTKPDASGRTPIFHAVNIGSEFLFDLFVTMGVDLRTTDNAGNTLLMISAGMGHKTLTLQIINRVYIGYGVDYLTSYFNAQNAQGSTALHLGATNLDVGEKIVHICLFLFN